MSRRGHLSIGEVLSLLQEEFPDITISKIRFLESQGLLDPERTPSGYRKFYDHDIDRLRWVLRQQKEHFLPLKVIKERMADGHMERDLAAAASVARSAAGSAAGPGDDGPAAAGVPQGGDPDVDGSAPTTSPAVGHAATGAVRPGRSVLDGEVEAVRLRTDAFCEATGLGRRELGELQRYGLIVPREGSGEPLYDEDALAVGRAAAAFRAHGVEARHLRMYKVAAEREAGYYQQLLMPLFKQRGARSRKEARAALDEVLALGDQVRTGLLRAAFGDLLES